jgi:DNA modification methylase
VTLVIVHRDDWLTLYQGDWLDVLRTLPDESVHCVVTSPPYWGLRDYGVPGQLGLEPTPEKYVARLVEGFREVRRVLRRTGTLWLNLGDSYAGNGGGASAWSTPLEQQKKRVGNADLPSRTHAGLKPKDLVGIPWRVAFALQADGWYLRSDIIWAKPNPMPESVTDRPTKAHEYLFLLSRSARYYYDAEAVREEREPDSLRRSELYGDNPSFAKLNPDRNDGGRGGSMGFNGNPAGRNLRSVWTIATEPYPGAHFATFPQKLVEPCILAGCPEGGTVLDPFAGSGTVGLVAERRGRRSILIELSADYVAQAMERIAAGRRDGSGPALDLPLPAPEGSLWDVPA